MVETKPNIVQCVLDPNRQFGYQHNILSGSGKIVFPTEKGIATHFPGLLVKINQRTAKLALERIYIRADDLAKTEENPNLAQGYQELAKFALYLGENYSILSTLTPPIIYLPAAKNNTEVDTVDSAIQQQTAREQTFEQSSRRSLRKKELNRQKKKEKKKKSREVNDVEGKKRRRIVSH